MYIYIGKHYLSDKNLIIEEFKVIGSSKIAVLNLEEAGDIDKNQIICNSDMNIFSVHLYNPDRLSFKINYQYDMLIINKKIKIVWERRIPKYLRAVPKYPSDVTIKKFNLIRSSINMDESESEPDSDVEFKNTIINNVNDDDDDIEADEIESNINSEYDSDESNLDD